MKSDICKKNFRNCMEIPEKIGIKKTGESAKKTLAFLVGYAIMKLQ